MVTGEIMTTHEISTKNPTGLKDLQGFVVIISSDGVGSKLT